MIGGMLELTLAGAARVGFTTRADGDLGRTEPGAGEGAVHAVRERVRRDVGLESIVGGRQVHGVRVATVRAAAPGYGIGPEAADGQATGRAGVGVAVHVADCLPVAVAGPDGVAMLHAGWRGLAGGVIAEGVAVVRHLSGPGRVEAAIGPGAGGCCYEVGEEVHASFAAYGPNARRGQNLDLKSIARVQLERAGVDAVEDVGLCTICSEEYFSHRRDRGITGRQAGIVWLT
jgi:YfiH family protein